MIRPNISKIVILISLFNNVSESIVFPNIIGVIKVAIFAKTNNRMQVINLNLNLFDSFSQRNGLRKSKSSRYLGLFFKNFNLNIFF